MTGRLPLIALILSASPAGADGQPQIRVDHPAFDFGSTAAGHSISHAFVVHNPGDAPLEVSEVTAPCRCLHATFDKRIAPGQAGRIQVDVDTAELRGPVVLTARIHSSDPQRPLSKLSISGQVRGPVALIPNDHLDLTTVAGEDQEQALVLEINRKQPLHVTRVDSARGIFVPRLEAVTGGRRYRIVVKAKGSQPVGLHKDTVRIHTDDKETPVIPVECSLLVVSSVTADPETLFLSALSEDEARRGSRKDSWKVVVKNLRGRAFAIAEITSDLPFVRTRSQLRADGKSYDVFVELQPNQLLRPGRSIGTLHVKTNLPDAQDVKVPVWVEVR